MRDWRRSPAVAVAAIVIFFAIQLAIPISRMGPPHTPERFGWQMFSNVPRSETFVIETQTGTEEIDLTDHLAHVRGDLDLTDQLPSYLCAVIPGAVTVSWESGQYQC